MLFYERSGNTIALNANFPKGLSSISTHGDVGISVKRCNETVAQNDIA